MEKKESVTEFCSMCCSVVELEPNVGIQKCPECDSYILACDMCEGNKSCLNCKLQKRVEKLNKNLSW